MSVAELGAIVGLAVGIVTLIAIAVRVGASVGRIEEGQRQILEYLPELKELKSLNVKVGTLEAVVARHNSDITALRERVAHLKGEATGRFRTLSHPDLEET